MPGTKVISTDVETGDTESVIIVDDYVIVTDGTCYVSSVEHHPHSTIIVVKHFANWLP